jgi:hypothetical protein
MSQSTNLITENSGLMLSKTEIDLDRWDQLPTQSTFYADDWTNILLFSAGLGSGKTHVLCRKALKLSAINRGYSGGLLVPTYPDFRRDVKPEFEHILTEHLNLKENVHWTFHNTYKEYRFIWNKKPLYILTGEKPIAGPNLAYCLINEYSLIHYERVNEMMRRVRVKGAPLLQKCLAGTPEDVHGWLEEFVERQENLNEENKYNFRMLIANTDENKFVDENYGKELENQLDPEALKIFKAGQIGSISSDKFYYSFSKSINVTPVEVQVDEQIHVGMDFNVGKMTATCAYIRTGYDGKKRMYIFDEFFQTGNSDTNTLAKAIKDKYGTDRVLISCDRSGSNRKTSGLKDIQILRDAGFRVRFKSVNPRMRDRQLLMNGLLAHGQIIIDPSCRKTILDFKTVKQNIADATKVKDKDDKLTHLSDGVDYVVDWEFQLSLKRKSRSYQL